MARWAGRRKPETVESVVVDAVDVFGARSQAQHRCRSDEGQHDAGEDREFDGGRLTICEEVFPLCTSPTVMTRMRRTTAMSPTMRNGWADNPTPLLSRKRTGYDVIGLEVRCAVGLHNRMKARRSARTRLPRSLG
jgi:hypothetical protein